MNRKLTMIMTVLLWSLCCLVHYYFRTINIFQGPRENDLYVYSWVFQGMCFGMFQFPLWLCGLVIVLFGESLYFSRKEKMKKQIQKGCLIGCCIALSLPAIWGARFILSLVRFSYESTQRLKIVQLQMKQTDAAVLLGACRQLMDDPRTYDEEFLIRHSADKTNDVWRQGFRYQYSTNLPAIIRKMSPVRVAVSENEVYALVHAPPRIGFIASREGYTTEVWGDKKTAIRNGLWYFIDLEGGWK